MFSIQEQCSQFKNNVLSSRTMFLDSFLCVLFPVKTLRKKTKT